MPIEIRELVITTSVQNNPSATGSSQPASAGTDAIVAACVEQVMEILEQKNDR